MKNKASSKARCGLCGKTKNLMRTDCCGNWICNDQHKYVLFSYARNSCARNHARFTLCGFHRAEGHEGHWRDCKLCRESFPTEMYVWYGTNEYNFEVLENPPLYEPTRCTHCGTVIKLGTDMYSTGPHGTLCENCCELSPAPAPILCVKDRPSVVLKSDDSVGLYLHYEEAEAEEFGDCLTADELSFSLNPPEAKHLAWPGKALVVFGRRHPRVVAQWLEDCGEEVLIDSRVAMPEDLYEPPVKQLFLLDEPDRNQERDYTTLGISLNDAPDLIRMAADHLLHEGPQDSRVVWAPIHAWRALAQLRAEEAIVPLVQLFDRAADCMDEWVSEDLPRALARFGTAALAPLMAYLASAQRNEWSRLAAATAIVEVGRTLPDARSDCIALLSKQLESFSEQSDMLNAGLVWRLMDLRAVEAMPVIERAFASGRVDESVVGDLEDVQIDFGLKTRREGPRKPNALSILGDRIRAQWMAAGLPLPDADDYSSSVEDEGDGTPYIAPPKTGRNQPCPCGSGKKYKRCCGA